MLCNLVLAQLEGNLGEVALDQHHWQWEQGQDLLACLTDSVDADAIFSEATRCEDIRLVGDQASHMNDLTGLSLLTSAFIVGIV